MYQVNRVNELSKRSGKCASIGSKWNNHCVLSNQIEKFVAVDDDNPE